MSASSSSSSSSTPTLVFVLVAIVSMTTTTMTLSEALTCFESTEGLNMGGDTFHWIQPLSLENRLYYTPSYDDPRTITVQSEMALPNYVKSEVTCLEEFPGNRMLVKVKYVHQDKTQHQGKTQYQCLMFETLAPYVVRQSKTRLRVMKKKVDCEKEKYEEDQAVMIAYDAIQSQPCPLQGGYQMLLHEGEIIRGHCIDSVFNYNPNIRFQCDNYNVIADFGRDCEPPILRQNQKMRRRHIAHLSCVASWTEKEGTVNSLLLRMRDMPYTFWCIHYRKVNTSIELLSIFMTLDGRCSGEAFQNEDFPKKTSLFGHLASFVPADDPRCFDEEYLESCRDRRGACFDGSDCPSNCKRCNRQPEMKTCSFSKGEMGNWKTTNYSRHDLTVDVNSNSIRVSRFGEFSCAGDADWDHVYPVIQHDKLSTCLPYYACAKLHRPIPGLLYFHLRPAWRDEDTGTPFTCQQTHDQIGYVIPVKEEETVTLIDFDKLQTNSCGLNAVSRIFPTLMTKCLLEVVGCNDNSSSGCDTLEFRFDNATCSEQKANGFPIETELQCYGNLKFEDGLNGIVAYSAFSERYFCLLYSSSRLFISAADHCNPEMVLKIFNDKEAAVSYDPALALSIPLARVVEGTNGGNDRGSSLKYNYYWLALFSVLSLYLWHFL